MKKPLHIPKSVARMIAIVMEAAALVVKKEPLLSRNRVNTLTSSSIFSIQRAQRELGYNPKVNLEQGIAKTISWYKENGVLR